MASEHVSWYRRRSVLIISGVAIAVGLALGAFGVAAFASASDANDQAAPLQAQIDEATSRTGELQQQVDTMQADIDHADTKSGTLRRSVTDAQTALTALHIATHDVVDVYNGWNCGQLTNKDQILNCQSAWLVQFDAVIAAESNATDAARKAVADLEGAING